MPGTVVSVLLTEEQRAHLAWWAAAQHVTMSAVMAEAVDGLPYWQAEQDRRAEPGAPEPEPSWVDWTLATVGLVIITALLTYLVVLVIR